MAAAEVSEQAVGFTAERAIREVRALARELGISAEPVVVAERSNLVLRLDGERLVARVALATSAARVGMEWFRREVEVTRFLSERGALVTRPSTRIDAGPFERAGLVVSFWELEDVVAERAQPRPAGAGLAAAHRLLASYPTDRLPTWGGFEEARQVLARVRHGSAFDERELARLDAAWERAERIVESARSRTASFQAIHGDAHIGNVLATARGAVWTDWEDAFVGPVEFDIACLRSRADLLGEDRAAIDAMIEAYDQPWDRDLVRDLGLVRNVQVIPWLALFAERQPELLPRMRARLDRLPVRNDQD